MKKFTDKQKKEFILSYLKRYLKKAIEQKEIKDYTGKSYIMNVFAKKKHLSPIFQLISLIRNPEEFQLNSELVDNLVTLERKKVKLVMLDQYNSIIETEILKAMDKNKGVTESGLEKITIYTREKIQKALADLTYKDNNIYEAPYGKQMRIRYNGKPEYDENDYFYYDFSQEIRELEALLAEEKES